jgi:hypothetical protein
MDWFAVWMGSERSWTGNRGGRLPARGRLTCEELEQRLVPAGAAVIAPQLTELDAEFLPYQAGGPVASFVPSNDLESLDVAHGEVAINVLAFVSTSSEVVKLGGQVTDVRYLPVAFGLPGIEVQAMLPIGALPALGALANVASVTPLDRTGPAGSVAPAITTNPTDQITVAGEQATFTAAASGVVPPTVQWQVSSDKGMVFINIAGATSPTLPITTVRALLGAGRGPRFPLEYRAVFTNKLGQVSTTAATLTVHPYAFAGSISGTYVMPSALPDVGQGYVLSGSGTLGAWGPFQASGSLSTPGFIFLSTAYGTLTVSNGAGSVTLWLQSMPLTGFSTLPQDFDYGVQQATGAYAGLSVAGTIKVMLTPAAGSADAALPSHGTFTLTIAPGAPTTAGVTGVVRAGTQPQSNVLITAQVEGGGPVAAWAVSNSQGHFQLFLPPGIYLVRASAFFLHTTSKTVIVPTNGFAHINVSVATDGRSALADDSALAALFGR